MGVFCIYPNDGEKTGEYLPFVDARMPILGMNTNERGMKRHGRCVELPRIASKQT